VGNFEVPSIKDFYGKNDPRANERVGDEKTERGIFHNKKDFGKEQTTSERRRVYYTIRKEGGNKIWKGAKSRELTPNREGFG